MPAEQALFFHVFQANGGKREASAERNARDSHSDAGFALAPASLINEKQKKAPVPQATGMLTMQA